MTLLVRSIVDVAGRVPVEILPITISGLAFGFAIGSFWWLNARQGRVVAAVPETYAFATDTTTGVRLRFPLALLNTGAAAHLVTDFRAEVEGARAFPWITSRSQLMPSSDDGHSFCTPFALGGREARELIAEFGDGSTWMPSPGAEHMVRLKAKTHRSGAEWVEVAVFRWWAPPADPGMHRYITYRNEPRT